MHPAYSGIKASVFFRARMFKLAKKRAAFRKKVFSFREAKFFEYSLGCRLY